MKPKSGAISIQDATKAISALQLVELIDRGRRSPAKDRDHDAQTDGDLGGRDDHHEEDDGLTTDVVQRPRERDEGEVDGVQHQFDAHEHDERRTPGQESEGADAEEPGGQDEIPRGGDVHAASSLATGRSRRASKTAPTTAMMSNAAVASKAKRYVVKTAVPSWRTLPLPVESFVVTDAAPVTQCERAIRAMRPPMVMTTPTAAKARWPTSGSKWMCSRRSTPRNMITNKKSTTMAPAYTMICTAARKSADCATKATATPINVMIRHNAAWTGFFTVMTPIAPMMISSAHVTKTSTHCVP